MDARDQRIEELESENELLRHQLDELRQAVGVTVTFPELPGITPTETKLLGMLARGGVVDRERIWAGLHAGRWRVPQPKTLDVQLYNLRNKLRPAGIEIRSVWGIGYELPPASLELVRAAARPPLPLAA